MELSEFNIIKEKIAKFVEITDSNISDRILQWAKMYSNVLSKFVEETRTLSDMRTDLDEVYGKCVRELKDGNRLLSAKETDHYVLSDPKYKTQKIKVNQQEMIVNYFENALTMIKNLQFNLKSYVDLKMFLGGK